MLTDCGGFWHFIKIYIKGKCSNTKCEKNWHVKRGFKVLNKIKVTFVRILCVCHQFDMIRGSFCLFCYIWARIMQKKKLRALATSKLSWVGLSLLSVCPKNSLRSSQLIQNAAANILSGIGKRDHISLYRLPIKARRRLQNTSSSTISWDADSTMSSQ